MAARFLASYLAVAFGRASPNSVIAATPELRVEVVRERAQLTPAERRRRPAVRSLRVVGMTPGFVLATATIADGGIAVYPLRFTLVREDGRWAVSGVSAG